MEKTEILTISKEELIKRRNLKKEKNYIEYRGSYIASLNAYNLYKQSHEDLFKYPCRLNTFFLLICKRGKGRVSINLNEYEIEDNTLFIYTPNHIICLNNELEESSEREGVMIGFDEHMPREVNFDIKQFLPLALQLKEHPVIKIAEEECDELLHIIQQLGKEIANAKEEAFQDEVIHTYFLLFFIKLCHIMNRTLHARPVLRVFGQEPQRGVFSPLYADFKRALQRGAQPRLLRVKTLHYPQIPHHVDQKGEWSLGLRVD